MESVREVARQVLESPKWLNAALDKELRMEAHVSITGIMVILVQWHLERSREWALVAM